MMLAFEIPAEYQPYGLAVLGLPVLWFLFLVARKVVKWGWFIVFALVGFGLMQFPKLGVFGSPTVPLWLQVAGALAFAGAASALRARVARIIWAAFFIALSWLMAFGWHGNAPKL